jgi:plasmid maintenance system killer protein
MDHLSILEKIYDNWWPLTSSDLEQNLAKRLVMIWKDELEARMIESYRTTRHQQNRLEQDEYYKKWIDGHYMLHIKHKGLQNALIILWEYKYGIKQWM